MATSTHHNARYYIRYNIRARPQLPGDIQDLARHARLEGHHHIIRLRADYLSGENRFDKPGEQFFTATAVREERTIAVAGLNIDPYVSVSRSGRLRRMFVHPAYRRRGIARALLTRVEATARTHFDVIRLFTESAEASQFYLAAGYIQVQDMAKVSHLKPLC